MGCKTTLQVLLTAVSFFMTLPQTTINTDPSCRGLDRFLGKCPRKNVNKIFEAILDTRDVDAQMVSPSPSSPPSFNEELLQGMEPILKKLKSTLRGANINGVDDSLLVQSLDNVRIQLSRSSQLSQQGKFQVIPSPSPSSLFQAPLPQDSVNMVFNAKANKKVLKEIEKKVMPKQTILRSDVDSTKAGKLKPLGPMQVLMRDVFNLKV